jgi:hypothetical protein
MDARSGRSTCEIGKEEHIRKTTRRTSVFGRQQPCPRPLPRSFVLLILPIGISGCGRGFNVNHVTVTESPAAATIQVNGRVRLTSPGHLDFSGGGPIDFRDITGNSGANCTRVDTPPDRPCPAGTIQAQLAAAGPVWTDGDLCSARATAGTFRVFVADVLHALIDRRGDVAHHGPWLHNLNLQGEKHETHSDPDPDFDRLRRRV